MEPPKSTQVWLSDTSQVCQKDLQKTSQKQNYPGFIESKSVKYVELNVGPGERTLLQYVPHGIAISNITREDIMTSKAKMTLLRKTIDTMGMTLKPKMLESIEDGMKSRKKATLKKHGYLTTNYLMEEIKKDIEFQEQMARLNITLEDMDNIARRIVVEHEKGPATFQSVGRNDPCPCGSGKKYKKCCKP